MRRLAIPLLALAMLALAVWLVLGSAGRVASRLGRGDEPVAVATLGPIERVVVRQGMVGDAIAQLLEGAGVIGDADAFTLLLRKSGASSELQAGCYELARGTPPSEVIRRLRNGITTGRTLAVPEGLRPEEVVERAVRAGIGNPEEWSAALASVAAEPGPPDRPAAAGLTGYLLPAAYPLECDTNPEALLRSMVRAFAEQVTLPVIAEVQAQGLTLHQALTIASIVEREAVAKEERPIIASVFRNRLEEGVSLDADPTVQYAIATPESVALYGWWKRDLTLDDLATKSPYNTYTNAGLPPGPIANPGIDSIVATVRPAATKYLYFVAKGDGTHVFAETLAEHNRNVRRYINGAQ